jgi:hypothetical protein
MHAQWSYCREEKCQNAKGKAYRADWKDKPGNKECFKRDGAMSEWRTKNPDWRFRRFLSGRLLRIVPTKFIRKIRDLVLQNILANRIPLLLALVIRLIETNDPVLQNEIVAKIRILILPLCQLLRTEENKPPKSNHHA